MSSKNTDAVAVQDVPEAHGAIGWACGQVIRVRVEAGTGDIREMAGEYTEGLVMVSGPQSAEKISDKIIWYGGWNLKKIQ